MTYNLHIILRFEIELALITGNLSVSDIPCAWNEKFEKLFNLHVPDDAHGCLQDAHWPDGDFGYFPTYTLGNLYAAQFFHFAQKILNTLKFDISRGDFTSLLIWLKQNIYIHGSKFSSKELVRKVTGELLNHKYLIAYLRDRYVLS